MSGQPLRLLQFTDMHLVDDPRGRLRDLDVAASFAQVLGHALQHHWPADRLLLTGDLVHEAGLATYQRLHAQLSGLDTALSYLPGNHDQSELMRQALDWDAPGSRVLNQGGWQIILLDSSIPGAAEGHLAEPELQLLQSTLSASPDAPALVCMHHNPVPTGSRWLDSMQIDNHAALFRILDNHPQVRALLFGHVHQEIDRMHKQLRLLATPSTCFQFRPQCDEFDLDDTDPGYRWLHLYPDGQLDTAVVRVQPTEI